MTESEFRERVAVMRADLRELARLAGVGSRLEELRADASLRQARLKNEYRALQELERHGWLREQEEKHTDYIKFLVRHYWQAMNERGQATLRVMAERAGVNVELELAQAGATAGGLALAGAGKAEEWVCVPGSKLMVKASEVDAFERARGRALKDVGVSVDEVPPAGSC